MELKSIQKVFLEKLMHVEQRYIVRCCVDAFLTFKLFRTTVAQHNDIFIIYVLT